MTFVMLIKTKVKHESIEKLTELRSQFNEVYQEHGIEVPEIQSWLVSTGGFTEEVINYVDSQKDMYRSDHDVINNIFKAFGGNYSIPVFYDE